MYLLDFFKGLFRKSNIPIIIYLILNVFVIGLVIWACYAVLIGGIAASGNSFDVLVGNISVYLGCLLIGAIIYFISLCIALSPIGEWILRFQTKCKKIKRKEHIDFIEPIYREVNSKSTKLNSAVPGNVRLFMNEDSEPNAFATGRHTICITKGLLNLPEEQIKATLAHEYGHIAHKDTDMILFVTIGNFVVSAIVSIISLLIIVMQGIAMVCTEFLGIIPYGGGIFRVLGALFVSVAKVLAVAVINGFMWLWTKLGTLLVMKTMRSTEYDADEFSFNCGYGEALCKMLDTLGSGAKPKGVFAVLTETHPDTDSRIAKLQELGVEYKKPRNKEQEKTPSGEVDTKTDKNNDKTSKGNEAKDTESNKNNSSKSKSTIKKLVN